MSDLPAAAPATIDMRDPAFRNDPHPLLRAVRERGRVERDVVGIWLATTTPTQRRPAQLAPQPRTVTRTPVYGSYRPFVADSTLERTTEHWMLFNDPPEHTRLRRLVNAAFKPRGDAGAARAHHALTDELLAALPAQTASFDLMATLAQQLPVRVICDVLGLPPTTSRRPSMWSDALAVIVEPVVRREQRQAADRAAEEMVAYLRATSRATAPARARRPARPLVAAHERRRAAERQTSCWAT